MTYYFYFYLVEFFLVFIALLKPRDILFSRLYLIVAVLFAGLRTETGYDYFNYVDFFYNTDEYKDYLELGNYYLLKILVFLELDVTVSFFLYSLITCVLIYLAFLKINKKKAPLYFLLFLIIPGLYLNFFSIIRQGLAASIFFLATVTFIKDNKFLSYIFWACVAGLFHYSVTVAFIFTFIFIRWAPRFNFIWMLLVIALALFFKIFLTSYLIDIFPNRFLFLIENGSEMPLSKFLAYFLLFMFLLGFKKITSHESKDNDKYFFVYFLGFLCQILFFDYRELSRMAYYFMFFAIPLVISSIYVFRMPWRLVVGFLIFCTLLSNLGLTLYGENQNPSKTNLLNYNFIGTH
jgi:transmembrane protein EpsG